MKTLDLYSGEVKERLIELRKKLSDEYWQLNDVGIVESQRAVLVAMVVMQYKTVKGGQKFISDMNEAIIDSWMGYGWGDRYAKVRKRAYGSPLLAVLDAYIAVLGYIRREERAKS